MKAKVKLIRYRVETAEVEIEVPNLSSIEGDNELEFGYNLSSVIKNLAENKATEWKCGESFPASFNDEYDKTIEDTKECLCGHHYYRHFDSYERMNPVGCKYCGCNYFIAK